MQTDLYWRNSQWIFYLKKRPSKPQHLFRKCFKKPVNNNMYASTTSEMLAASVFTLRPLKLAKSSLRIVSLTTVLIVVSLADREKDFAAKLVRKLRASALDRRLNSWVSCRKSSHPLDPKFLFHLCCEIATCAFPLCLFSDKKTGPPSLPSLACRVGVVGGPHCCPEASLRRLAAPPGA